jgi:hypothetical protein
LEDSYTSTTIFPSAGRGCVRLSRGGSHWQSRRNACDSNLAHALDSERVDLLVPLIDEDHIVRALIGSRSLRSNFCPVAVLVGEPAEPGRYVIRVKVRGREAGTKGD